MLGPPIAELRQIDPDEAMRAGPEQDWRDRDMQFVHNGRLQILPDDGDTLSTPQRAAEFGAAVVRSGALR